MVIFIDRTKRKLETTIYFDLSGYRRGACANQPGGTQVSWRSPSEVCAVSWQGLVVFPLSSDRWSSGFVNTRDKWINAQRPRAELHLWRSLVSEVFSFGPIARLFSQFGKDLAAGWGVGLWSAAWREAGVATDTAGLRRQGLPVCSSLISPLAFPVNVLVLLDPRFRKWVVCPEVGHRGRERSLEFLRPLPPFSLLPCLENFPLS